MKPSLGLRRSEQVDRNPFSRALNGIRYLQSRNHCGRKVKHVAKKVRDRIGEDSRSLAIQKSNIEIDFVSSNLSKSRIAKYCQSIMKFMFR